MTTFLKVSLVLGLGYGTKSQLHKGQEQRPCSLDAGPREDEVEVGASEVVELGGKHLAIDNPCFTMKNKSKGGRMIRDFTAHGPGLEHWAEGGQWARDGWMDRPLIITESRQG